MNRDSHWRHLIAALTLGCMASGVRAETYRVDLIVFLQNDSDGEAPSAVQSPALGRAIEPADAASLRAAGIRLLPEGTGGLGELWSRLANSRRYQALTRLSWEQKDPPEQHGPALHVTAGGTVPAAEGTAHALDGSVALLAGHYLHLDVKLVYTQAAAGGEAVSWPLDELRRVKLDEVHYLDSPRLGVLARVTKAE
jgi:hypothetical protein